MPRAVTPQNVCRYNAGMGYELIGRIAATVVGVCSLGPLFGKEEDRHMRAMVRVSGLTLLAFCIVGWMLPGAYKSLALIGLPVSYYLPVAYIRLFARG